MRLEGSTDRYLSSQEHPEVPQRSEAPHILCGEGHSYQCCRAPKDSGEYCRASAGHRWPRPVGPRALWRMCADPDRLIASTQPGRRQSATKIYSSPSRFSVPAPTPNLSSKRRSVFPPASAATQSRGWIRRQRSIHSERGPDRQNVCAAARPRRTGRPKIDLGLLDIESPDGAVGFWKMGDIVVGDEQDFTARQIERGVAAAR